MKRLVLTGVMAVAAVLVLAAAQGNWRSGASGAEPQAGVEWEYLIVAGGTTNLSTSGNEQYPRMRKAPDGSFTREQFPLERNLDKLGAQGWELIAVQGSPSDPVFYLKRPRQGGR